MDIVHNSNPAFNHLEKSIFKALEIYSNVHRGSGHKSMLSTHLIEQARILILNFFNKNKSKYTAIFCSYERAKQLTAQLEVEDYSSVSCEKIGLNLGVVAIIARKSALQRVNSFDKGGGSARLVARDWVVWANLPDRFEAGTPAIVNILTFTRALIIHKELGQGAFKYAATSPINVNELLKKDDFKSFSGIELFEKLRECIIGLSLKVPTKSGQKRFINLDSSASTPTFKPVWDTFKACWNLPETERKIAVNEVINICSEYVNAPTTEFDIVFTSNTTESINIVANSLRCANYETCEPIILNTQMEHSSNDLPWRTVNSEQPLSLNIDNVGFINPNELERLLINYNREILHGKKRIKLIAITAASNVLGTCNDLAGICNLAHKYDARVLVDAAQLVAHAPISMQQSGIDFLVFSAHKMYAPFGVGVLVSRKATLDLSLSEITQRQQAGIKNAAGIAAMGKAMLLLSKVGLNAIQKHEAEITQYALKQLNTLPNIQIFGIKDANHPKIKNKIGVISFNLKSKMATGVASTLMSESAIGVRSGCHCAHIIIKKVLGISPGLEKFQRILLTVLPKVNLPGVVRISYGLENTKEDIDILVNALKIQTLKGNGNNSKPINPKFAQQLIELKESVTANVLG